MSPKAFACIIAAALVVLGCAGRQSQTELPNDSAMAIESSYAFAPEPVVIGVDSLLRGWYLPYFAAMGEPRLGTFVDSIDTEVIRFFWLRSFHPTIAIRAIRRGSRYALIAVALDNDQGGMNPGKIARRDSAQLSERQWNELRQGAESRTIWNYRLPSPGLDGANWVVERVAGARYSLADVWSPEKSGPEGEVRSLGLAMLKQAGFTPRRREIY